MSHDVRRPRTTLLALLVAAALCVAAAVPAGAATPGTKLWAREFSGRLFAGAADVAVSPDGSEVFVTGTTTYNAHDRYATVAYDASTGATLWIRTFLGGGGFSQAKAVAVSPDGSTVFVTGTSYGEATDQDYVTIAYDAATGTRSWVARYNGRGNGRDEVHDLGVSPDGSTVYVTGGISDAAGDSAWGTIALDASTGTRRWVKVNPGGYAQTLAVSPDGSAVFVSGPSTTTVAYDASSGQKEWHARYVRNGNEPIDSQVSADASTVFVLSDLAIVAYDASTGTERWLDHLPPCRCGTFTSGAALVTGPDSSTVFVTGQNYPATTELDIATEALDASTGSRRWVAHYDGASHFDFAEAIAVSPDGSSVLVTGASQGPTTWADYATIEYDAATGSENWDRRFNGPGKTLDEDYPSAIAVNPSGMDAFVTGTISMDNELQGGAFGTVGYAI
jgi:WD40 repeat protein